MGLLFLATFASEDLACISAGFLVAHGRLTFLEGFLGCFLGIFAGDLGAFLLGRGSLKSKWICRQIAPEKLQNAQSWIARRGAAAVFIGRFTPGLRVATYFSAGLLKMSWWKFVFQPGPSNRDLGTSHCLGNHVFRRRSSRPLPQQPRQCRRRHRNLF